ncbi:hypothetical protein P3X46_034610 [Hevea brasiliensis]|uniref:Protein kinase domain-containing protein n=1 Tax=Hevea brasiliensis TaxID=3981 RepID=A0ABQ9K7V9_HEVBR|nr:putative serine/threonine-protein kinase-like protein CCR3 [Hevea brasiliensis]KAJ9128682.1 hypothetical protein P3X46_034610 [Hevea brasiliensis]
MAESIYKDEEEGIYQMHNRVDGFNQKVTNVERVILLVNFFLELPSAVLDQLSSERKPKYALLSMLMSFTVLIISIIDLVYKGRKERVTWMKRGLIPWFYFPYPNHKAFGTFPDIVGIVCAIFQCVSTSIAYAFLSQHAHNPMNINVWPVVFASGLLFSRFSGNPPQRRPTPLVRRLQPAVTAEKFTVAQLAAATNFFSPENKIGAGNFAIVYKGELSDGREVAVKRGNRGQKLMNFQGERTLSELASLSRIYHKHLVRPVGYCEDRDERLVVYEYMENGSLHDHLHDKTNNEKNSTIINSWKMRIKIALDAARGIEYLHNSAIPTIIHRDIKSSNILLDSNWTARVSDFGLSLMIPESKPDYRPMMAVGTAGYIDPEYYYLNVLTTKSDVYSLGVVLLELLTGKTAVFKDTDNGGTPKKLVDFAVPKIAIGELVKVLDARVRPPELNEAEAVELVAYTALHCVNLVGLERPTTSNIVANLERALSLFDASMKEY